MIGRGFFKTWFIDRTSYALYFKKLRSTCTDSWLARTDCLVCWTFPCMSYPSHRCLGTFHRLNNVSRLLCFSNSIYTSWLFYYRLWLLLFNRKNVLSKFIILNEMIPWPRSLYSARAANPDQFFFLWKCLFNTIIWSKPIVVFTPIAWRVSPPFWTIFCLSYFLRAYLFEDVFLCRWVWFI